ncbi:MAG: peptidoglycan DD-metalloendopeptidase family protein [Ruminococcus sp.]|nr:peptidoglycan DD-metalloendopeptidase family protein [Ruminococcus sp.]
MSDEQQNEPLTEESKGAGFGGMLTILGAYFLKVLTAILLGFIKGLGFIFTEIKELFILFAKALRWIFRDLSAPMKERIALNRELQREMAAAKKIDQDAYKAASKRFWKSYLFGKSGLVFTSLNYLLPIVSIIILISVIRYGSGIEYGISIEYKGKELGVINSESEYDEASREIRQRISYAGADSDSFDLNADLSLKLISGGDKMLSSKQLANEILAASDEELSEGYGVYIDGTFVGAVKDKDAVQEALDENLLKYPIEGVVKDVSYKNDIEYAKGMYLAGSVLPERQMIKLLTSSKKKKAVYVAQSGDTSATIAQKFSMDVKELEDMNAGLSKACRTGRLVNVTETESYLPIKYIREIELISFLDYETIEVETSELNLGTRETLVKGERGEKVNSIEITYVDGKEYARRNVGSKITKVPVVEQIGIGTYKARPYSADTKLYGTGQFAWPVDGGWVSDVFISDRNHKGFDIAADMGTDIYAAGDGVVVSAGWNPGGYGYFVMIDHLDGYQTVYAHMSQVYAVVDTQVKRGQLIGAVGSTGDSTGPHCHFEVRYMGVCYDPAQFMYTADYTEDMDLSERTTDINGETVTTTTTTAVDEYDEYGEDDELTESTSKKTTKKKTTTKKTTTQKQTTTTTTEFVEKATH